MDKLISDILTTRRAHNSPQELRFVAWLRNYITDTLKREIVTLSEGCVAVVVGKDPKTLFSCHVDTVHNANEEPQNVFYDENFGHIFLDKGNSNCLGADDGAGIYILLKMIEAKVPGGYIFHRGEERGGIGANAVLKDDKDFLKKFKACIAFDRPRCDEVIITQGGTVCASEKYGKALAEMLNKVGGFKYATSTRGVFTDSKVYRGVIGECINIGVGYENQHTPDELQDWKHLEALTKAACTMNWDSLPFTRIPVIEQPSLGNYNSYAGNKGWQAPKKGEVQGLKQFPKSGGRHYGDGLPGFEQLTLDIDFSNMSLEEIDDIVGDKDVSNGIAGLLVNLAAEKAKVEKLYELLGMS